MKKTILGLLAALLVHSSALALGGSFPTNPDENMTPGSVCMNASSYRYPEKIRYCDRNVETATKNRVIAKYDSKLGYRIGQMERRKFKIDHLIPLCAGGSNEESNLWPQHESVYNITDPLEPVVCEKMAAGRLTQKKAIQLILEAKHDLDKVEEIIEYIQSL